MTPKFRKWVFETLYKNRYFYRFASTVPFAGQWRVWQRLALPRIRGTNVLELGCGLGDLLADMLEAGYSCQAIEQSPEMVAAARDTLKHRKVGQPGSVIQGTAQALPFSNETFDTVVSTFPNEYIYDPDTISEIARVLRPAGRLIVIEGANLLPVGVLQPLLVLLQTLIYGPSILFNRRRRERAKQREEQRPEPYVQYVNYETNSDSTTDVLPDAPFGSLIPLEQAGLRRRSERVRSRRWIVYIVIGEKPQ